MKTAWLIAKIIVLLAAAFAIISLGLLLHETQVDLGPVATKLSASLQSLTDEMDAARQTTQDVDSGVAYEVQQLKKPPSKAMIVVKGIAEVLGKFIL